MRVTTKSQILGLLQRKALTVAELCDHLGVTRNAINVQIRQLQAEGLVRRSKSGQQGALGKPAVVYEAAPGSEDVTSSAYRIFLISLLAVLEQQGTMGLSDLLDETGRRLARDAGLAQPKDFESGLKAAMAAADALGASTEVVVQENGVMVRNFSCPLGTAVRGDTRVCRVLAAFFSEATGRPATEQCSRDGRLICQYLIDQT